MGILVGCFVVLLGPWLVVEVFSAITTGHDAGAGLVIGAYAVEAVAFLGWLLVTEVQGAKVHRERQAWLATLSPEERCLEEERVRRLVERREKDAEASRQAEIAGRARFEAEAWNYQCSRCRMRIHRDASVCPYCGTEF